MPNGTCSFPYSHTGIPTLSYIRLRPSAGKKKSGLCGAMSSVFPDRGPGREAGEKRKKSPILDAPFPAFPKTDCQTEQLLFTATDLQHILAFGRTERETKKRMPLASTTGIQLSYRLCVTMPLH